ncbi:cation-transporting ATPase [Microbacterium saperdae]|uniref:Cation-transporting ATPase n=1 Tax=Microbacterium saperdae TaxID=69368 RepID=A0A543BPP4_9MICO|nr:cation-transporting ATPase [Microbacterium saperdae]TQL86811.1 hypothetical protein FB560_2476 [Microbacterium saperdae]GGM45225.1 hypothetical protein GCM10010489_15380 [Microbacterium saperdae]
MGKLSRLLGLASEALDKSTGSTRSAQDGTAPRSTDWGDLGRRAVDVVRGPSTTPPGRETSHEVRPTSADPSAPPPASGSPMNPGRSRTGASVSDTDRAAIARYDYLLRTADPAQVERIHRDAFSRLTPQQREHVAARMREELAPEERPPSASSEDLARAAGRSEAMNPGRMRGLLSRVRGGGTGGAVLAGGAAVGVLGAVAGGAVLSAVAAPLLEQAAGFGVDFESLAAGLDVDALAGGFDVESVTGGAEELVGSVGDTVSGLGETASGWGEQLGNLGIPGIGDLFGR